MDNNNLFGQGEQNTDQNQQQQPQSTYNQGYQQANYSQEQQPAYGQEQQNTYSQEQQPAYSQGYQQSAYGQEQQNTYSQGQQQSAYNQGYQQPAYNQGYQQPYNQNYQQAYQGDSDLEEPVTFGDWMLSMIVMMIPCVNLIMMFVWAFGSGTKKSKANYFKAMLAWTLIWFVLMMVMMIGLGATIASIANYY